MKKSLEELIESYKSLNEDEIRKTLHFVEDLIYKQRKRPQRTAILKRSKQK